MEFFEIGLSLVTLIILEIILGIDNLILLSILSEKLPVHQRKKARQWGLTFSWATRLLLLALAVYMVKLTTPLITISGLDFSARDIFLVFGGGFLIWKATDEIHQDVVDDSHLEKEKQKEEKHVSPKVAVSFRSVILQIGLMDIIFSLDSVLTAVGLTTRFWVMAVAISCAILVMIYASESVSRFISAHPTIKMLALSYLILIGMVLVADGFSFHIPRGYLYFAMGFSLSVEALNLIKRSRNRKKN